MEITFFFKITLALASMPSFTVQVKCYRLKFHPINFNIYIKANFLTGYEYYFPFLDDSCGIETVEKKIIRPLYKQFLNIEHPSMCFIGLLQKTFVFPLFDLQVSKIFFRPKIWNY